MYDICIIGSGAGAAPIAYELTKVGAKVVILERGGIYTEKDFSKDEIAYTKRDIVTPNLNEEYHTIEELQEDNTWMKFPTYESGWSFWNGNILGGSSNFMSGYFHRLKPNDFKLLSTYGKIKGANIVDWPISYDDLEPYYEKVERVIGVSGDVTKYKHAEPRSTKNFPYPPLKEHPITKLFDKSCKELNFTSYRVPRAILSKNKEHRDSCYYSNYCGSYGCSSGAKGSARAALLYPALKSNNLTIISNAFVYRLEKDNYNKISKAHYYTKSKVSKTINAKIFVVAAQAVETSRLLLNSDVGNSSGEVGKNILFSAGGVGSGEFDASIMPPEILQTPGLFVNRALKDWYFTDKFKGGTIDFLFEHANPIRKAALNRYDEAGNLLWGKALQEKIYDKFTNKRTLNYEVFNDWAPNDNCFVSVDSKYKDKYGIAVANIRIGAHPQDMKVANFLSEKGKLLLKKMGAKNIKSQMSPLPSQNLQAGGCRFGDNPKSSVLNRNCQSHDHKNLFVTDGSFMPTGGSVPYTWTIYANSFRVAEYIKSEYEKI